MKRERGQMKQREQGKGKNEGEGKQEVKRLKGNLRWKDRANLQTGFQNCRVKMAQGGSEGLREHVRETMRQKTGERELTCNQASI